MLYDGDCRFCRANVRFLQKADRGRRLTYVPMRGAAMREMVIVDKSGRRHSGGALCDTLRASSPSSGRSRSSFTFPARADCGLGCIAKLQRDVTGLAGSRAIPTPADWNNMMLRSPQWKTTRSTTRSERKDFSV